MTPSTYDAPARQSSGELSPVPGQRGNWTSRSGCTDPATADHRIAELRERSTPELRLAWRQWYRTDPPPGLSRDLLIRALAHQLQEQSKGGASRRLSRRLRSLAREIAPSIALKTGTTLVRQWRGHAYTVLVRDDGFGYEGQHYRSLSVIAERITGAHWSGPRFFGLTTRSGALAGVENRQ